MGSDDKTSGNPDQDHHDHEEHSKRKRIAAIASRFASLATSAPTEAAKKASGAASDASHEVAKAVTTTRHAAATQTAGLLQAMALTTKTSVDKVTSKDTEDNKHWYEYESPLHARRRLTAIANQLGLATSSAKQAPSLLAALSSSSQSSTSSASSSGKNKWSDLPAYKDLPSEGGWPGCAWKVWGRGDQLGTINLLTDEIVLRAAKEEIKTGRAVSLNWPVHLPAEPFFRRKAVTHKPFGKAGPAYTKGRDEFVEIMKSKGLPVENKGEDAVPVSDEILELNTQSGSQWDGLRHFGHQPLNIFYGGASRASIQETFNNTEPQPGDPQTWESAPAKQRNHLGIQNLAQHGICGRGVLLDVFEYLSHHGLSDVKRDYPFGTWPGYGGGRGYDPRTGFRITVEDLIATAKHQGVTFRPGDILLVRSGFTARYYSLSAAERADWSRPVRPDGGEGMTFAGVEQGEAMKEFMWDNHFAAVAGDSPAFEARPTKHGEAMLHETFLAFWGMPIGELFDLEQLAKTCKQQNRYTFYFASWPLNLFGGIASTANASATF